MKQGITAASVLVVLTLSALVRSHALETSSYWIDEMVSLHFAKAASWSSVFWDNNPPLYHLLLKVWVRLFGDGEAATRTLSVFFSTAATGVLMRVGLEARGVWGGALAVGIVQALSLFSATYAQETRMYAMFEFTMALHLLFFLRVFRKGESRGLYVASGVLMACTHYLALVPLAIEAMLFARRWRKAALVFAMAAAVELGFYLNFFKWEGLAWQHLKFAVEPASRWPIEPVVELMDHSWLYALGVLVLACLVVWRRPGRTGDRSDAAERRALLVLLVAPFAFLLGFGFVTEKAVFLARYFIYLSPVAATLVGTALVDLWRAPRLPRAIKLLPAALLLGGALLALPRLYRPYKEPWRKVAEVIAKYPNALVLTTRTVAIATPYFERADVEVEKWDPSSSEGMARLYSQVARRKRVWIVENYWGGRHYLPLLTEQLKDLRYNVSELSMRTDDSPPVLVLLVEEPRP